MAAQEVDRVEVERYIIIMIMIIMIINININININFNINNIIINIIIVVDIIIINIIIVNIIIFISPRFTLSTRSPLKKTSRSAQIGRKCPWPNLQ